MMRCISRHRCGIVHATVAPRARAVTSGVPKRVHRFRPMDHLPVPACIAFFRSNPDAGHESGITAALNSHPHEKLRRVSSQVLVFISFTHTPHANTNTHSINFTKTPSTRDQTSSSCYQSPIYLFCYFPHTPPSRRPTLALVQECAQNHAAMHPCPRATQSEGSPLRWKYARLLSTRASALYAQSP